MDSGGGVERWSAPTAQASMWASVWSSSNCRWPSSEGLQDRGGWGCRGALTGCWSRRSHGGAAHTRSPQNEPGHRKVCRSLTADLPSLHRWGRQAVVCCRYAPCPVCSEEETRGWERLTSMNIYSSTSTQKHPHRAGFGGVWNHIKTLIFLTLICHLFKFTSARVNVCCWDCPLHKIVVR